MITLWPNRSLNARWPIGENLNQSTGEDITCAHVHARETSFDISKVPTEMRKGGGAALQKHNQQLCWTSLLDWILLVIPLTLLRIEPPHEAVPVPQTLAPACVGSAHPFVDYLEARVGDGATCMQIIFKPQDSNSDLQGWVLQTWFLPNLFSLQWCLKQFPPNSGKCGTSCSSGISRHSGQECACVFARWVVYTTIITFQQEQIMWKSWMRSSR